MMFVGSGRRARVVFCVLLLLCPSIVRAFHLLSSSRSLRSTRRLAVDAPLAAALWATHNIVNGSKGLVCNKCGETMDFNNKCEAATDHVLVLAKINPQLAADYALKLAKFNAQLAADYAFQLAKIKELAKMDFVRHAIMFVITCLFLAFLRMSTREVGGLVKETIVHVNSTRERLFWVLGLLASGVIK